MSEKDRHLRGAAWIRGIGIAAAVGIAYFLAAELSNSFLITPETVIFWPAAGIASGALVALWSIARWPVLVGVVVATAAANLLRHFSFAVTAAWIAGNTAEPLITALLIQYYFGARFRIDRLYCILGLFIAGLAGAVVASTWWTFAYYWLFASLKEPVTTWFHWIVSDLAGILSVAPLVIGIAAALRRYAPPSETIWIMAALAVLSAMTGVIVLLPLKLWNTVVPAALVFPSLLWLAARWQPVFSAAGAFIVSMTVALTAIYGFGHFGDASLSVDAKVLQTQAIILVVSFGTTILAALFSERREIEGRLAHSNMMLERERDQQLLNAEAIAASIAHEIRQPLASIVTTGETALIYLAESPPDLKRARTLVNLMISDGFQTNSVLDAIRGLFRKGNEEWQRVDLNAIILDVLQASRSELRADRIDIRTELESGLPLVEAHQAQLREVLINLVNNGLEAMTATTDRDRVLEVSTRRNDHDTIDVAIRDTGPGIAPSEIGDVFNAFFTTKPNGKGLGLAICRMVIQQHGGELTASSDGESGAVFQFALPIERSTSQARRDVS